MPAFTLIVPYYRNAAMLDRQVIEWEQYGPKVNVIVVDDGSPEPAQPIIEARASSDLLKRVKLYRITVDIPWNREGARNLAATETHTDWLVNIDIDHLLPAKAAAALVGYAPKNGTWYRFPRWRQGKADETRRKDDLPDDVEYGRIKPHIDSYLVMQDSYWQAGGYDEDYAGCLGGGSEFLRRLERTCGPPKQLPDEMHLHVYTRHKIKDASDWSLSRDTSQGKRITKAKPADSKPDRDGLLRFPWVREL